MHKKHGLLALSKKSDIISFDNCWIHKYVKDAEYMIHYEGSFIGLLLRFNPSFLNIE